MNKNLKPLSSRFGPLLLGIVLLGSGALAGCSGGSTTQAEVCASYDSLEEQFMLDDESGTVDVHGAVKDLGDKAARYDGDSSVNEAGEALKELAKQEQFSLLELWAASGDSLNSLCG